MNDNIYGTHRYPHNAVLRPPSPPLDRKRAERDLLIRIERAYRGQNAGLLEALMTEARGLISEPGGAA